MSLDEVAAVEESLRRKHAAEFPAETAIAARWEALFQNFGTTVEIVGHELQDVIASSFGDVHNHLTQAFLAVLRGQPKAGWANMRIAAESAKDLLVILENPQLAELWRGTSRPDRLGEREKIQRAYKTARSKVGWTDATRRLQRVIDWCSSFGSHAGSETIVMLGPAWTKPDDRATLPRYATDRDALGRHVQLMIIELSTVAQRTFEGLRGFVRPQKSDEVEAAFRQLLQDTLAYIREWEAKNK